MATRFHLQASGSIAAANNPSFDANWEQTGQTTRLPMDATRLRSVTTALANSSAITVPITTTQDILCYQFVSNQVFRPVRLDSSVTVSMVIRVLEGTASANAFLSYSLRAFSAAGDRSLGTLASSFTNTGTEFATSAATRIFSAIALTATTISEPWRLVLDLGAHAQAPAAADTFTMRAGCNAASDFALTSALTTDLNPWMELSANLDSIPERNIMMLKAGSGISISEGFR